jgi:hypothetical protein
MYQLGDRVNSLIGRRKRLPDKSLSRSGSHDVKHAQVPAVVPTVIEVRTSDYVRIAHKHARHIADGACITGVAP